MVIPHKNKWVFWGLLVVTWTIAFLILGFLRNFGWPEQGEFKPEFYDAPGLSLTMGTVVGSCYFLIELVMNQQRFRRMVFPVWAMIKSVMHLGLAFLLFWLVVLLYPIYSGTVAVKLSLGELLFSQSFLLILFYFYLISLVITLFIQLNQRIGPGILKNMLVGKYHHPREEDRIFLFVDLRSSTTIAEKLGHIRFSRLIQDCFADITDAVIKHDAEIYQYVGDEVILCWKSKSGLKKNNCIEAYLYFAKLLTKRAKYYQNTYGTQPTFKAGAHIGRMTVTEVGIIKRELAYLGDVLNTAARIQGMCNSLDEALLISSELSDALLLGSKYETRTYAPMALDGKEEKITIVGVSKKKRNRLSNKKK